MYRLITLTLFLFCSAASVSIYAQTANLVPTLVQEETFTEKSANDWSFYSDDENKVYYIDFQAINMNLNEIIVKNEKGTEIYKENVLDLPIDSIYELDLSAYPAGKFLIELRSFTSLIKKEVTLK